MKLYVKEAGETLESLRPALMLGNTIPEDAPANNIVLTNGDGGLQNSGINVDKIDAKTLDGKPSSDYAKQTQIDNILDGTTKIAKAKNADTAATDTKATQDGSGNTITSYYTTISTAQTISGAKTFSGATKVTNTTASSSTTTGALIVSGGIGCAGSIYGAKVYGAVYNDYAETRLSFDNIQPGFLAMEAEDDKVKLCNRDMSPIAMPVSDTFGFCIGEGNTPIAQAGRVLLYVSPQSEQLEVGDVVCSSADGMIRKMSKQEKIENPECIIGVVGSIPTYKTWGTENVEVNGRIWINLK